MENDMVKNIYKSPRRLRAKYTQSTNLEVYALDISPLRGAAGQQRADRVSERNLPQAASDMFRYSPEIRKLFRDMPGYGVDTPSRQGKHPPDVSRCILRMPESINAKEEHHKKTCICAGEQAEQFKRQNRLYFKSQKAGTSLCSV